MNAERWRQITETFDSALEWPAEKRIPRLNDMCGDDVELRDEVARLLAEFEKAGDFLEKPLATPGQSLSAGDLIAERYRIEALIGRGGMGEVYRAQDQLIGEAVALKVLRPELTGSPDVVRRFQREVQLARRVTHPNVCRVFDVGIHNDSAWPLHFFTMQLLEGETLSARIRRAGRMTRAEAFPLIVQMADGLQAAHQVGVIHHDFKSSNIMLTGDPAKPAAIVMDFGLARFESLLGQADPAGSVTSHTQIAGTIAYMSPEQLSGGEVAAASDIYSLGVVLFEMATGQLPFESNQIIKSAMQRAAGTGIDIRTLAPKLDPRWESAITRCLQRDPAHRFPTAGALSSHFRQWRPHPAYWSRRQWAKAVAIAAGVSLLAVSLSYAIPRLRYRDLQAGAKIVLTPTDNATGEERFNAISTAVRTSVAQSARFNVWDSQRLSSVLQSMRRDPNSKPSAKDWREIAFREGSPLVVFSNLSRVADGYRLNIHAEQIGAAPDSPMRTWDESVSAVSPAAVFDAIHNAASWIRTTAGETPAEISTHNRLPQDITSSSWEALQLYDQAQQLSRSGKPTDAIPFLRRAVDLDQHFAMALMRLGDILVADRNGMEGFPLWSRAIEQGRASHLSDRERLNIESRYALEIGDFAKAETILREWAAAFPNDPQPVDWLIPTLRSLGQGDQAISTARRRVARFGPSIFSISHLIHALGTAGNYGEIPAEVQQLQTLGAREIAGRFQGIFAAVQSRYTDAERFFVEYRDHSKGIESSHAQSLLANLAARQGNLAKAKEILSAGYQSDRRQGWIGLAAGKASSIAFLEYAGGNPGQSAAWMTEAVSLLPSPAIIMQAATLYARQGRIAEARKALKQMPAGVGSEYLAYGKRAEGEIALAEGKIAAALDCLEDAARQESAIRSKAYLVRAMTLTGASQRAEIRENMIGSPWLTWNFPESEWPALPPGSNY